MFTEQKQRDDFERMLAAGTRRDVRGREVPTWWKGDEEAARSSLAMARALGVNVSALTATAAAGAG